MHHTASSHTGLRCHHVAFSAGSKQTQPHRKHVSYLADLLWSNFTAQRMRPVRRERERERERGGGEAEQSLRETNHRRATSTQQLRPKLSGRTDLVFYSAAVLPKKKKKSSWDFLPLPLAKNRDSLPDNFLWPLCVSVWWWIGKSVFWLGKEEMKFEEGEGAFTDSYRRVRAPSLCMRIAGAGEPIKTLRPVLICWD